MSNPETKTPSERRFAIISWGITGILVIVMLGAALWTVMQPVVAATRPVPEIATPTQAESQSQASMPAVQAAASSSAITRRTLLKTNVPERPRYDVITYTVSRGDSVFGIAEQHGIKPETLLWANYDVLQDSPDSLRVGQVLNIPPIDGVYYQWKEGDSFEGIANEFEASLDDILDWQGNRIDLTNPSFSPGTYIMVPGGHREFVQWIIPTVARGRSGTASVGGSTCSGGAVGGGGFIWPAPNHFLSGNDYWSGHLGIDIAAGEGSSVYAADSGVVTMSQGGWNYGYGNVVMVDHGNGYVSLYAHLSVRNVVLCQSVGAGSVVGLAGNTGNSFGPHLHFEVRLNGGFVNPWYVLPPP